MPALCSRYCGMVLYLPNSACHAAASSGGITPVTGFHSTIDRPDSVSRVAPPTTTVTNIRAATASSHSRTARPRDADDGARLVMGSFVWRQCGSEGPTTSRQVCKCPFASEVRTRACRKGVRTPPLGHECRGPYRRAGVGAIERKMPIRLRKFIGAILLILLVVTWALLAMALAQSPLVRANGVIEALYYVVAGLGWVLPAMPLIRWMSRPDPA